MKHNRFRTITACLIVLATLAVVLALYFGRVFLVPIVFAMVLNSLFRPLVRFGQNRLRLPAPLCATVVVLGIIAVLGGISFGLSLPLKLWFADLPKLMEAGGEKLQRIRAPIKKMTDTFSKVQAAVSGAPASEPSSRPATTQSSTQPSPPTANAPAGGSTGAKPPERDAGEAAKPEVKTVEPAAPGPPGVFGFVEGLLQAAETLLLLALILAGGGVFLRKLVQSLPHSEQRRIADEVVHESESVVLRYVLVTAMINVVQGAVVSLIMWWLGMPTPLLWGLFTFVLEFVPYLGAAVMLALLSVVALVTFDSVGHILLVPGSYLLITNLQNNLVSPIAYGSRLKLNPAAVLVGVAFWFFVWGIPGAFLAVPIVATMKIACDRIDGLKPIGAFLGD